MAGTIRGTVDAYIDVANRNLACGEVFKLYFDALESHAGTTRIALYYGTAGTGTDYHDEANPFGDKAWAVWRFDTNGGRSWPFYVMLYTSAVTGGTNGGDWLIGANSPTNGSSHMGIATAVGFGGDGNPWNGTTNNDGTDTVGTPRWANPAGGTGHSALPASNRDGGGTGVTKNATVPIFVANSDVKQRASIILDDDSMVLLCDRGDDSDNLVASVFVGMYEVAPHVTVNYPLAAAYTIDNPVTTVLAEDLAGVVDAGGVARRFGVTWDTSLLSGGLDQQANAYVPQRQSIRVSGSAEPGHAGFLGWYPEMFSVAYGPTHGDTDTALDHIFWTDGAATKFYVSWDGTTTPLTTLVREGVTF